MKNILNSRRSFLKSSCLGAFVPSMLVSFSSRAASESALPKVSFQEDAKLIVEDIKVHIVKVNQRGNWIFIELKTNKGITGLGEASHGASSAAEGQQQMQKEIATFFEMVKGESSFAIEQYRQQGWERARSGKTPSTAFSAIEQALWDINGKALGAPVYQLIGGKMRDKIKAYANINRATNEKDANGRRPAHAFQKNAELALQQGFKAIKMAPFDEMKALPSTPQQVRADIDHAVHCLEAVRKTIGNDIDLLVDVHSHLNQPLGIEVAQRVEPLHLFWFEEAVNPEKFVQEAKAITAATSTTTAGGESIFGREGFAPLIHAKAFDILMPDVKFCGGILELKYIAAMAETAGIQVAPHNPSGPLATSASVHPVATMPNFSILEMAYGEVPWRSNLVSPAEVFIDGYITVSDQPGLGYQLNQSEIKKHS
jgi:galactonate dehydratase